MKDYAKFMLRLINIYFHIVVCRCFWSNACRIRNGLDLNLLMNTKRYTIFDWDTVTWSKNSEIQGTDEYYTLFHFQQVSDMDVFSIIYYILVSQRESNLFGCDYGFRNVSNIIIISNIYLSHELALLYVYSNDVLFLFWKSKWKIDFLEYSSLMCRYSYFIALQF